MIRFRTQHRETMAISVIVCALALGLSLAITFTFGVAHASSTSQPKSEKIKTLKAPKDFAEMVEGLQSRYQFTAPSEIPGFNYETLDLKEEENYFLPINAMKSGQHEISFDEVKGRLEEFAIIQKARIRRLPKLPSASAVSNALQLLHFDKNKSLFPLDQAGQVVLLKDMILLIDGNHKVLSSIWLGATSFAVKIKRDLRHLSLSEAMPDLIEQGLMWPYRNGQKITSHVSTFTELHDNPLRNWVADAAGSIRLKKLEDGSYELLRKKFRRYPLAVKIQKERAYWEWIIVLALEHMNFKDYIGEEEPSRQAVARARELLFEALNTPDFPELEKLATIFVLSDPETYKKQDLLLKEAAAFILKRDCKPLLP